MDQTQYQVLAHDFTKQIKDRGQGSLDCGQVGGAKSGSTWILKSVVGTDGQF